MIGRGPGLLGGARLQLRDVGGMVYMYFLFALVLFAALSYGLVLYRRRVYP